MGAEKTRAVIDADFFIKLAQYDKKAVVFQKIMDDLNIQPVMHEYVARKEIKTIPEIQDLIQEGKIIVLNDTDYITDENREDYEEYFKQAYEIMNHYEFPDGEDIYTYECPDESLGEIRYIFMVKILGYPYFMSDDGNARRLAEKNSTSKRRIITWSIYETLQWCKECGTSITWKMLNPIISNIFRNRQEQLNALKKIYNEQV